MTATVTPALMTADALAALPDDGNRYELVRGTLICMSPSFALPSVVSGIVLVKLGGFILEQRLGLFGTAEGGFKLATGPDIVRAPDVWFVRAERIPPGGIPEGFWPGAPDLAVEVLSPSDRFTDVMQKITDYLDAGTRLVWAIDPRGRSAGIFPAGRQATLIDEDGRLEGTDLLPGFSVLLRDLLP